MRFLRLAVGILATLVAHAAASAQTTPIVRRAGGVVDGTGGGLGATTVAVEGTTISLFGTGDTVRTFVPRGDRAR